MGRNCISTYLNRLHSALRKDLRSLRKKTGLSICNHYLPNRFISCWCSFFNESAHNFPRHTRLRRWWINGPYICNCRRYRLASRAWKISRPLWRSLGALISCWTTTWWLLLRSRRNLRNNWLALDFLHKSSLWNPCPNCHFNGASYP